LAPNSLGEGLSRPLPIPAEVHAGSRLERQLHHGPRLGAVVIPPMTLTERALLGVASQIDASDVMMMADLTPAQAAKEAFRAVRASDAVAVRELMVDPLHDVVPMQIIPAIRLALIVKFVATWDAPATR